MIKANHPTVGFAFSGSGNRSTFYIGFLEAISEAGIPVDFIAASSGGSLVAAAYACGALKEFKTATLSLNNETLKQYITKPKGRGGLYSLDKVEEEMLKFTKGLTFEEVRPLMSFSTVDIETGEKINLCMGDIARAARISCTLPGIFEPAKWGNRTLVDGGLLSLVPVEALKQFPADITVGVNMRGTRHIFTDRQVTLKKALNFVKKIVYWDEMSGLLNGLVTHEEEIDFENNPRIFTVLGKSLDLAIAANQSSNEDLSCDLMIEPGLPLLKRDIFAQFHPYYEMGRDCAVKYTPKIQKLIEQKLEEAAKL